MNQAILALEDGTVFEGKSFGAPTDRTGEVVFNTAITGYQEIFTDPSYAGQIVVLTNPQIGNYGANEYDEESARPYIEGLIVREFSPIASNWRSEETAGQFLTEQGIPVAAEIDTRALVRHLRTRGVMRGILSVQGGDPKASDRTRPPVSIHGRTRSRDARLHRIALPVGQTSASVLPFRTNCRPLPSPGATSSPTISESSATFCAAWCMSARVLRWSPRSLPAEDVLSLNPDGIFLSNGPGDPEPLQFQAQQVRKLIGKRPIFGICLGHQILGLALGGKTYKLKFGHRGANHPVLNKVTNKVEITSHNHGFAVDPDSLNQNEIELTHVNLNDQTLEGFRHRSEPVFCVQYHPEAAPGPHDSQYLFGDFMNLIKDSSHR